MPASKLFMLKINIYPIPQGVLNPIRLLPEFILKLRYGWGKRRVITNRWFFSPVLFIIIHSCEKFPNQPFSLILKPIKREG